MKTQIRRGLFETNSSSVHTLTICTLEDYNKFKNGKLFVDAFGDGGLSTVHDEDNLSFAEYEEMLFEDGYEGYLRKFSSPSGDNMMAFGYYGASY